MLIAVLNVGDVPYAAPAIEVLRDYFNRHNLQYCIVRDIASVNTANAHPSWLKLLMHKVYPGNQFILNWDLDLLPIKNAHDIGAVLDMARLNMAMDSSLLADFPGFNPQFKYNGGLMGIPNHLAEWAESIYYKNAPGLYPSYEQYYLNDAIVRDRIPVNRLPDEVNTLFPRNVAGNALWRAAEIRHYTFGVLEPADKLKMIKEHRDTYFSSL